MSVPENKAVKYVFMDAPFTSVPGFHIKTRDEVESTVAVCAVAVCPESPVGEQDSPRYRYAKACAERIVRALNAAPDLLAALERMTDQLERIGDSRKDAPFIEEARAAILKAKGGTS